MDKKRFYIFLVIVWYLLSANTTFAYTHADTLRGSNGSARKWWDVKRYDLSVELDTGTKSIKRGVNIISFRVMDKPTGQMQIDLQDTLRIDSVFILNGRHRLSYTQDGNAWFVNTPKDWQPASEYAIIVYYHGKPRIAKLPPWEGGFIWARDSTGKPWISVACQGLGASSWWPCKDYQGDEPDRGMDIAVTVPGKMTAVSNGRLLQSVPADNGKTTMWEWHVVNPINTYDATFYIGDYVHWQDTIIGEKGKLDLDFYVLRYNEERAKEHFAVTKQMLHCFEYWMGPYPFYEDGYKLVEAPFLGMEHQSAVAYGNEYKMGYRGSDRSATGVGNKFDFIIVHESGHEWFGNNITAADIADNWIHEGFTTYTETLFAECLLGKEDGFKYTRGEWSNIRNDQPVIGDYNVQDDGSSDKYDKGSAVVHMIRMMMNNDAKFRELLRGMNEDLYHRTVTENQVEQYIIHFTGMNLIPFFNQYLRTTDIPVLEWYIQDKTLHYRFTNTVDGFTLPVYVAGGSRKELIHPTKEWQSVPWKKGGFNITISEDFLVKLKP